MRYTLFHSSVVFLFCVILFCLTYILSLTCIETCGGLQLWMKMLPMNFLNHFFLNISQAFRKETDFSRSFKNWQINSFLAAIGSKVEFPHCAECPQVTQESMSRTETSNAHSITGSGKRQVDYPHETSSIALASQSGPTPHTAPATTSHNASHKSNDSMSSTHSFAFPM